MEGHGRMQRRQDCPRAALLRSTNPLTPPLLLDSSSPDIPQPTKAASSLLQLLLRPQLVAVAALALAAVGGTGRETGL